MALISPAPSRTPSRLVMWLLLGACAILPLGELIKLALRPETLFPDFFGLWSFGRFVLSHAPGLIYSDPTLAAYQHGLGLPKGEAFYPFPYPPWILILLAPLGSLPYGTAHLLWLSATFAAYAAALSAWRWRPSAQGLLLLAPASAICLLVGQNGFLSAALMIGGVRALPTRPLLAGVLLASLAFKPQLAVLAPFLLLFGRHWRALMAAAVWTAVLSGAVTVALGSGVWIAWLGAMREHAAALSGGRPALLDMMPTVTSAVLLMGGSFSAAHLVQRAGSLFSLLALWRTRDRHDVAAQAVFPLATILATPYAFDYDLPAASGALMVLLATRAADGEPQRPSLVFLIAGIVAPGILFARVGAIAATVPLVFAGLVMVLCGRNGSGVFWSRVTDLGSSTKIPIAALAGRVLHWGRVRTSP